MPDFLNNQTPQFNTAEFAGTDVCKFCKKVITGVYFRVNNQMACGSCADEARREGSKDTHAAYMRALLLGVGGAFVGFVLYAAFVMMTGVTIGYLALAVGFLVGKAMLMGSGGIGGRRYQITAVLLTYAAVSTAAIPIYLYQEAKETKETQKLEGSAITAPGTTGDQATGQSATPATEGKPGSSPIVPKKINIFVVLGTLLLIGLASPFMELFGSPLSGLLGIVILYVGLQIAWKMTRGVQLAVDGPFQSSTPPSVAAG